MVKKSKHCLVLRHIESLYRGAAKVMSTVRDLQSLKPLDTAHQWLQFRAGKPHFRPLHFLMGWEEKAFGKVRTSKSCRSFSQSDS